jgi:hypothetical protein
MRAATIGTAMASAGVQPMSRKMRPATAVAMKARGR